MRIIAGAHKGRVLAAPGHIRPTKDMVRKAVFDILGDVSDLSFLELYAGSGAVGLEAFSRGASPVVLVDSDPSCARCLEENVLCLEARYHCFVMRQDVVRALQGLHRAGKRFDVVFMDPPYHQDEAKNVLKTLGAYDIVAPAGILIAEHSKKDMLPEEIPHFKHIKQKSYGDTALSFYRRA